MLTRQAGVSGLYIGCFNMANGSWIICNLTYYIEIYYKVRILLPQKICRITKVFLEKIKILFTKSN